MDFQLNFNPTQADPNESSNSTTFFVSVAALVYIQRAALGDCQLDWQKVNPTGKGQISAFFFQYHPVALLGEERYLQAPQPIYKALQDTEETMPS